MRDIILKINGKDRSDCFNQYGFFAGATPVYSDEIETMDRVRHSTVVRRRGYCIAQLNDISDAEAVQLAEDLSAGTLNITYNNPWFGSAPVTQNMTVDDLQIGFLLRDVSGRFWSGQTLRFTQR